MLSNIEFKPLEKIDKDAIINLMNHPKIRHHMPLLTGHFDNSKYDAFIHSKQKIWNEHGYGPWAFILDGNFIGWGGLQPIDQDIEIALVLHPDYWGYGKKIYQKIINQAFNKLKLESVIILLPPSRTRIKAIRRLGFDLDGEYKFSGEKYIRYRLYASQRKDAL
jgi:ribosomal-protein-alanine N-acetyltransferase